MSPSAVPDQALSQALAGASALETTRPQASLQSRQILALTGLRGYAALWVVLSHVSYTDAFFGPLAARLHWRSLDGLIRHEYLAVDLFFMLSGFVLTHVHGAELDDNLSRRVYGRFLLLRLARVYPLHLLGLLLTAATHAYSSDVYPSDTVYTFFGQVFLVSSWGFAPAVNWNPPAWSLSSEWMAYLVFPCIALATAGLRRARWQCAAIAALCACFYAFIFCSPIHADYSCGPGAALRVLIGAALGSVLRRLYDAPGLKRMPWAALFWLGLPLAAMTMTTLDGARRADNIWAWLAMPALLFAAANARGAFMLPFTSRLAVYFGEISFAVYILHHPVLQVVRVLLRPQLEKATYTASEHVVYAIFLALLVVVMLFAALAHTYIEVPVRNWARRRVSSALP